MASAKVHHYLTAGFRRLTRLSLAYRYSEFRRRRNCQSSIGRNNHAEGEDLSQQAKSCSGSGNSTSIQEKITTVSIHPTDSQAGMAT